MRLTRQTNENKERRPKRRWAVPAAADLTGCCAWRAAESACRPGSVIPSLLTCGIPLQCRLSGCFTSHGFSSVLAFFRRLAEQRRNWRVLQLDQRPVTGLPDD